MSMLLFSNVLNDPNLVNNARYSSQNASYQASNAYDLNRRRRVWRSGGYFNIISTNKTLIFRESVGVDLTATLVEDEYTSDSTFLAAIVTALEAAGASEYTATRDATTGRVKIASDGSGGGGIFQMMLTNVSSSGLAGVMGYSTASDLTGALSYEADVIRLHTSEWLEWDLGFPANPTGFIAIGDRNNGIKLSPGAVLKLQGNWTNDWSAPAVDTTLTYNDFGIVEIDEDGLSAYAPGYRYWRFYIEDKDNPNDYVELGAVMLGIHSDLSRGCPEYPLEVPVIDRSNVAYSEGGQAIVGRKPMTQAFRLSWRGLDNASKEELESFYEYFGTHSAFFIAMDPNGVFSSNSRSMVRLVRFEQAPSMRLETFANWSMQWQLREEL